MSRYANSTLILIYLFSFFHFVFCQLPPNQIATMTELYEMLQNESCLIPAWPLMGKDSNPCLWLGVSCGPDNSAIVKLSLSWFSISSQEILPVLCQIDTLEFLDLSYNSLTSISEGFISGCGVISGLRLLSIRSNELAGPLPTFKGFANLEILDLSHNSLSGNISLQLSGLDSLKSLKLSHNQFTGPVPTNLGKSYLLQELQLSSNHFEGEIPATITEYGDLSLIDLSFNRLSGSIPDTLEMLSKIDTLELSSNSFSGIVPEFFSNIKTLRQFSGSKNNFFGKIPPGITRYLSLLNLSYNNLIGIIPQELLFQPNLQSVDLSFNFLEGTIPPLISSSLVALTLGSNLLSGTLPSGSFGSLRNLTSLELENNRLSGQIPPELGLCQLLAVLNLAQNMLTGVLPVELGNLSYLKFLKLQENNLVGNIPNEFTNLSTLRGMNISWNSIDGSIPFSISGLHNLEKLDLRGNKLSSSIPYSIGYFDYLIELQLGNNRLSGNIPPMPRSLRIALNLSNNLLEGPIPTNFSALFVLEVLDLSNNRLTGEIPYFLSQLALTQLLLSNNQLSGVVPYFSSSVLVVTSGNKDLVDITNLSSAQHEESWPDAILVICFISGFVSGFFFVISILYMSPYSKGTKWHWIINNSTHKSTLNFSKTMEAVHQPRNIRLRNEFYTYYMAVMPSGMNYCIKKIYWSTKGFTLLSPDAFAQNIQDLGKLNHPNIMSPLAYALITPSALIAYEWPQQGTLFDLLHGSNEQIISWEDRYRIAVGVASGLAFVHSLYFSDAPVVLLHLSTKSILMKSISEPLIGDFELHRIISPSQRLGTLSVVAGAVGYIPPEYAYTMELTTSGNVYSFGIILLELLTGKQAINEGVELAKWVVGKSVENDHFEEILDHRLSTSSADVHQEMLPMLRIALHCVSGSPEERPDAEEIRTMLLHLA